MHTNIGGGGGGGGIHRVWKKKFLIINEIVIKKMTE